MKFNMCQYFGESLEEAKGGLEGSHQGPRRPLGAPPRARREAAWGPGPTSGAPSGLYLPLGVKTLKRREFTEFRRRSVAETYREEKSSPAGRFRRGEHLPEGEIIAIVITIVAGIIEIIINIILTTSTISISIPSHLTIANCVVTRTIHPLYFTGVDYSFVVNSIKFWWKIIVMTIFFTTYLSPLIMISFMSCE